MAVFKIKQIAPGKGDAMRYALNDIRFIRRPGFWVSFAMVIIALTMVARAQFSPIPDFKHIWFEPKVDYETGVGPFSIARADFNKDGILDLVVANRDTDNLSIYLGKGDGTFNLKTDYKTGSKSFSVVTADFNGDGNQDLATINFCCFTVSILLGQGDGTFTRLPNFPVSPEPRSMTAGDFNRDGKADLAIAFLPSSTIWILIGKGDGTFGPIMEYETGSSPHSIITMDLNDDGFMDLMTANTGTETVSILMGYGDGTFAKRNDVPSGSGSTALTRGNFNNDGYPDLAVANMTSNTVTILLSRGDGTLEPGRVFSTGIKPVALAAGDFNGDRNIDLAVVDRESSMVTLLAGLGDGTMVRTPWSDFQTGQAPFDLVTGDFNKDGRLDIATANFVSNTVSVLLNVEAPLADLAIVKSGSPNPTETGKNITYTIKVTNNGPSPALNVVVLDDLPVNTTFVSCLVTGNGQCLGSGNKREFRYGSIAAGVTETLTLVAMVNFNVADKAPITNQASVMSVYPDPKLDDNQMTITTLAFNPPPVIVGLYDLMAVGSRPGDRSGMVMKYQMPTVLDNTPGATIECTPVPGSMFPVGVTTVNCKATDAGGATATGKFTVTIWDCFLQDDRTGDSLMWDSFTGKYLFISPRNYLTTTGIVRITRTRTGMNISSPYVTGSLDTRFYNGRASVKVSTDGPVFQINDSNYRNNVIQLYVLP